MENNINTPEVTFNSNESYAPPTLSQEDFSNIKVLGGLAALFAAGSIIPYIGFILSLASIVLFLIAFYKISVASGKRSIFSNIGIAYLVSFVAGIALVVFFIITFLDFFREYAHTYFDEDDLYYIWQTIGEDMMTTIVSVLIFYYFIFITYAYLWKLSLDKTAAFFNDNAFKTAGILYVIGAASIVLCGIGILVTLAANIVLAVAFFSLKYPQKV